MTRSREKTKGRKDSGSFVQLPHAILEHENFARLSHKAVRLLINIYGQYRGSNNGDLNMAYTVMKRLGWKSKDQLYKAKNELMEIGWIVQTRQGGRNFCSLYAVTFQAIDECKGKLDVKPCRVALGYWKLGYNPEIKNCTPNTGQADPPHGPVLKV